jgi:hypothetical protein
VLSGVIEETEAGATPSACRNHGLRQAWILQAAQKLKGALENEKLSIDYHASQPNLKAVKQPFDSFVSNL